MINHHELNKCYPGIKNINIPKHGIPKQNPATSQKQESVDPSIFLRKMFLGVIVYGSWKTE